MKLLPESRIGLWRRLRSKLRTPHPQTSNAPKVDWDAWGLAIAPDVRASVHDDGLALLHISTGRVFLCNRTGSWIWQGVMAGLGTDAISEQISRDCGVGPELVRRHIITFLGELERRGLVVRKAE